MGKGIAAALFLLASLASGCRTWGTVDGYKWSVLVPSTVTHGPGDKLTFTVETTTPSGEKVEGISYIWIVEWVNLHGWNHKGSSFSEQSISVKGSPGTAYVRIYAYDREDKLVEVAKAPFQVD
ncbi:MAG TPA: hypothetical protein VE981_03695 [Planctomycetota bacterium]|nr:hypothetical protein [Planctomycetota bacterium]